MLDIADIEVGNVKPVTGMSRGVIFEQMTVAALPPPYKLYDRVICQKPTEIAAWIDKLDPSRLMLDEATESVLE